MLDPLLQIVDLPVRATLYPLGFPLQIEANDAAVIEAARESWNQYAPCFDEAPVRLKVLVASDGGQALVPPEVRARDHLLIVNASPELFAVCDFRTGFGFAHLTPTAVRDRDYLRWYFLDAMVYSMLTARYLTALHAGCVARNGRGALLCGPSGSGKTTLTYACARAGLTYVGDDASFLLRRGGDRTVVGRPFQFRFRDSAVKLFPELGLFSPKPSMNGKPSLEVRVEDLPDVSIAASCEVECLVFLARREGKEAHLERVGRDEVFDRLVSELPVMEPAAWEEQRRSLERLVELPAYELRYSHLGPAVDSVARLLGRC